MVVAFDIVCYLLLLGLLLFLLRTGKNRRVQFRVMDSGNMPGTVLEARLPLMTRVGLLNTPTLAMGDGLLLRNARRIHTLGMHQPIDVIFLDRSLRVIGWQEQVAPEQRKVFAPRFTDAVLECGPGTIACHFPKLKLYEAAEVTPC